MPTYCTMPEATPLAPKKTKTFKGLVAGAALAAFLLGTVAATALRAGGGAPKVVVSLSGGGWDSKVPYEVCYDREVDGDNYKLKNKDSTGQYTVELAINPHDGNFLKFTCKDSKGHLYADC